MGCKADRYTFCVCERERESIYGKWKNLKEKNGYKRSNSRNVYWKNGAAASVNRYVKDRNGCRYRSQSNGEGFKIKWSRIFKG